MNKIVNTLATIMLWVMFIIIIIQQDKLDTLKETAIEQKCAHYNETDGQFEWLRKDNQ